MNSKHHSHYTKPATIAMLAAIEESFAFGDSKVDAEHLLLGLSIIGKSAEILAAHGLSHKTLRRDFMSRKQQAHMHARIKNLLLSLGGRKRGWTIRGESAVRLAAELSGSSQIGTQHLLLALLQADDGAMHDVFAGRRIDLERLRMQLCSTLE